MPIEQLHKQNEDLTARLEVLHNLSDAGQAVFEDGVLNSIADRLKLVRIILAVAASAETLKLDKEKLH